MKEFQIQNRRIGPSHIPLVIAEIGINHEGSEQKANQMIDAAAEVGCECVKFQTHIVEEEMIENDVVPGNADETIWNMMQRCKLSFEAEVRLKARVEKKGMIFLSTPFSRAAADRLETLGVEAYKIGSGECNNYPLVEHIARFGKPVILSTGMNNILSISRSVEILRTHKVPFALMHCTSIYPTPYDKVHLGAMRDINKAFPDAVLGLSDHTISNYTCYGAVALGACILERHFTANKTWSGPDIPISMGPGELRELITGSEAIHQALGGKKIIHPEEQLTIDFAYASVVSTIGISKGEKFNKENIWVKRPGTGEIRARDLELLIGRVAKSDIRKGEQLRWDQIIQN